MIALEELGRSWVGFVGFVGFNKHWQFVGIVRNL